MEAGTINWADDFSISENISDFTSDIIGAYARMSMAHPDHSKNSEWKEQLENWQEYYDSRFDHFYATQQEANNEVNRILKHLNEVLNIEKSLKS